MQLIIDIPADWDDRVLEAFGAPDLNTPIGAAPYVKATWETVEARIKNHIRGLVYAYEDNQAQVQTMRNRGAEVW